MDAGENKKETTNDSIVAFDTLYTTNEIQLLKIAMPLLSHDLQLLLATYIKVRELSFCYQLLQHTKLHHFSIETAGLHQFFQEAKPYCTKQQKHMFDMLESLGRTMQILEKMKLLGDDIPLDGNMDISTLMQFMPLFQSFQENEACEKKSSDLTADAECTDAAGDYKASTLKDASPLDTISPFLKNALTDEQKEIYEKFQKKFSSM